MRPTAPTVLRKGAIVRVAGDGSTEPLEALALSYLDLRFADGHIERWIGPGRPGTVTRETLRGPGEEVINTQGECLIEELAMEFQDVQSDLLDVPVEVVVEWNARIDGH
jgi:hypothetical protein